MWQTETRKTQTPFADSVFRPLNHPLEVKKRSSAAVNETRAHPETAAGPPERRRMTGREGGPGTTRTGGVSTFSSNSSRRNSLLPGWRRIASSACSTVHGLCSFIANTPEVFDVESIDKAKVINGMQLIGVEMKAIRQETANADLLNSVYESNLYELNASLDF